MPSPLMLPASFLAMVITVSVMALMVSRVMRRERQRQIRSLAREWGMHYSPSDRFNLAPRIATHLPLPGAADVRVRDLIYGTDPAGHRYIFSVEYTSGVVRSKARRQCVLSALELQGNSGQSTTWGPFQIAPQEMSPVEQYRHVYTPPIVNAQ